MAFDEVRFPEHISYGSSGGPQFFTTVLELTSGYEQRNVNWSQRKSRYNVAHGIKSRADMDELLAFFHARQGRARGFRYKDWGDYFLTDQVIGVGDDVTQQFPIVKTYSSGSQTYTRLISKPVSGTLSGFTVDGDTPPSHSINYNTGIITFSSPIPTGQEIVIGSLEFDVPCRFDTDQMDVTQDFWLTQSWPNIPIVEIRI